MSDSEVSQASLSSPSQKFIPQEDDEETLWEVIEITAEKGNTYKVRWKGNDPKTMKPWPQSWVQKSDCTDDLVMEWKRKQREKKKGSKGGRFSTTSKTTGRESTSTVGKASTSRLPATPTSKSTSRSASTVTENIMATRLKQFTSNHRKSGATAAVPTMVREEEEEEEEDKPPPPKPKGTKRKLADATSANSSAHQISKNTSVNVNVNKHGESLKKGNIDRPKKKRKIEVELVKPIKPELESEDETSLGRSQPKIQSIQDGSYEIRKPKGKSTAWKDVEEGEKQGGEEDEAQEEKMVEDVLSQASSPPFHDDYDMDDFYVNEPEVPPPPPPSKSMRPPESIPKDKGKGKGKAKAVISSPINSSPIKFGPPLKRRSLANVQNNVQKETASSKFKPKFTPKQPALAQHTPVINVPSPKSTRASLSISKPPPPPTERPIQISTSDLKPIAPPTEERSDLYDGPAESEYLEPILSPGAQERLARFDEEVMGIPKSASRSSTTTIEFKPKHDVKQPKEKVQGNGYRASLDHLLSLATGKPSLSVGETSRRQEEKARVVEKAHSEESSLQRPATTSTPKAQEDVRSTASTSKISVKPKDGSDKPKSKPTSTATTTSSSKSLLPRQSAPPAHSYNPDIVPETDESQSQSQEAKIPTAQPATTTEGKPPTGKLPTPPQEAGPSKTKPLRPIPVLSPSVFHPHLPPSSLPEDISEELSQPRKSSNDEEEAPMSSIEEFESPEKPVRPTPVILAPKKHTRGNSGSSTRDTRQSASDIWESHVVKRGMQMAEAAKKKQQQSNSNEALQPKTTMDQIIAKTRSRSGSHLNAQDAERSAPPKPTPIPEADEDEDKVMGNVSTNVVPPSSGPRVMLDEEGLAQEMENAYVDLNGGVDDSMTQDADDSVPAPPPVDPLFLREEEEESSQDLRMDIQLAAQQRPLDLNILEGGWGADTHMDVFPAIPETTIPKDTKTDASTVSPTKQAVAAQLIPEIVVIQAVPQPPLAANANQPPLRRSTRSRSRSQTPLPQPTRPNGKVKIHAPPVPSNGKVSPSPAVPLNAAQEQSRVSPDHAREHQLSAAIAKLEADLATERAKLKQQTITSEERQKRSTDVAKQQEETAKQLSDLVAKYESEKAEWENEKLQLTVQLDSANKGKEMADKDREFFREQYAKASGFVSSVRDENKDLEKRIKIAEEQTQTGVNLVRATFDLRIQSLEEDIRAWRRTAEFLIDKDLRTGNDEIRRRAAEEPELRGLCQRQQAQYAKAQERIAVLEADLDEKQRDCAEFESEIQSLRAEATKLHVDLNEALFKLDRIGRGDEYGDESMDPMENGHEFMYCCKWRSENEACREVFSTISELEQHLVATGGHLHHDSD